MHPPFQFQCEEFVVSYSMQDEIAARLAEGRFAMFRVHPTPDLPGLPFIYTVGLTGMGLPEIIISGPVSPWLQQYMIGKLLELYQERGAFFGVSHELLADGLRVELVEVDCTSELVRDSYIVQALEFYRGTGKSVRLVQIRWPDTQGRLPGEDGYDMADKQDLLPRLTH